MSKVNSISIVVSTSYKYRELIDGFTYFFEKYWSSCEYDVYITLEKEYRLDKKMFKFITSFHDDWSTILFDTLKVIDTEYIYLLLDDYFLSDYVDAEIINNAVEEMIQNNIKYLGFSKKAPEKKHTRLPTISDDYQLFLLNRDFKDFDYYVGAGHIYHRKSLIQILRKNETAWEFETFASLRAMLVISFKSARMVISKTPIKYIGGGVIMKGMIRKEAREFLDKENFTLDFPQKIVKVSTERTPLSSRIVRKIFRPAKIFMHLLFGKYTNS